jgi:hypothetical protein
MGSSWRTRIVTIPTRIGVRLANVGPPPSAFPSARAAAAAAIANEEAPAIWSKRRRVRSIFMVSFLSGFQMGQPIKFSIGCSQPWRVSITRLSVGRRRAIRREQTDNFQAGLIP